MGNAVTVGNDYQPTTRTVADLFRDSIKKYGARTALRFKEGDGWAEITYDQLGAKASAITKGLIALGIEQGDRVSILSNTRPDWTIADFGIIQAGAVVVPIYPTNSPVECEWVIGNSDARAVFCEDAEQVAKVVAVRSKLPKLEHIIVFDAEGDIADGIPLDDLIAKGQSIDDSQIDARVAAIQQTDDFTFIYTSGTTGPPKGCVSTHGNYANLIGMAAQADLIHPGEVIYLYLPLAHGFALVVQLAAVDRGATIAYFGGDTRQIVTEVAEIKPTYLPSVPRIFEKIFTVATGKVENPKGLKEKIKAKLFWWAVGVGKKVVRAQEAHKKPSALTAIQFKLADKLVLSKVRGLFGGNILQSLTGAAPIAPEILEFFFACGIPVLEGYGMTESSTAASVGMPDDFRIGSVGRPLPGVTIKLGDDGEILIKGLNVMKGYYKNDEATRETIIDGWLHTGDLGSIDKDGFIFVTGRKKDIIITAGGKNLSPANLENDLKQSRWISQAVMYADRRPYPVALITLDEEEIIPWAQESGLPTDIPSLAKNDEVRTMIQRALDDVNTHYAQVEQIKKFEILDHDLTQETGELTPTMKVKRNIVNEKYADIFDGMYS